MGEVYRITYRAQYVRAYDRHGADGVVLGLVAD